MNSRRGLASRKRLFPGGDGALIQSRAMDNFLRLYFAVPEARAVLKGKAQDPHLGASFNSGRFQSGAGDIPTRAPERKFRLAGDDCGSQDSGRQSSRKRFAGKLRRKRRPSWPRPAWCRG